MMVGLLGGGYNSASRTGSGDCYLEMLLLSELRHAVYLTCGDHKVIPHAIMHVVDTNNE
jgi:hypothetical protein